jgi:hypothetical protein
MSVLISIPIGHAGENFHRLNPIRVALHGT